MKILSLLTILLFTCTAQAALQLQEPLPAKGVSLPMQDHLTATAGVVDLTFTLPGEWPQEKDQTLLHVGEKSHTHLSLFVRAGALLAVYKADQDHYESIKYIASRQWSPGSSHRVVFQWRAAGDRVPLFLRVDGRLSGTGQAQLITEWPALIHLGIRGKNAPWLGTVDKVSLSAEPPPLPEHQPGSRTIRIDTTQVAGSMDNFWSIANYTRQDLFTNLTFQAQQKSSHPAMHSVNCVRLLGGRLDGRNRWFKGLDDQGRPVFDFTGMIAILQGIIQSGYTPRIVLDNVPIEMSGDVEMNEYGNTHPPRDYAVWEAFIEGAVRSMVKAFGEKRVAAWRFRVGTEPDLYPGHWIGTPEQYQHHYSRTVAAVQRVLPEPDIGPGNIIDTKHGKWGLDLVDYIATNNLPMTFFSCSWYGRVGEEQAPFEQNVQTMRSRLNRYARFKDLPLEIAEFAILQDENNQRIWNGDVTEWGASWYAGIAEKVFRLNVAQIHQWATTTAGLLHPRSHLHTLLGRMRGGERLDVRVSETNSTALAGAIAARRDGSIYVLLYNHRPLRTPQVPETVRLEIVDPRMKPTDLWLLSEWRVDRDHGVFIHAFVEDCLKAGLTPLPDSAVMDGDLRQRWGEKGMNILKADLPRYRKLAAIPQTLKDQAFSVGSGQAELKIEMPGHSVRLLKLTPP